ncbi:hypothetical protein RIF29_13123 [Crotalaria pallida]|uniref:Uncharacterized protein n=1 Tax=Crotalaria pallida TaxID=3830 RepID=A0AAN9INX1_CROPI
MSVTDTLINKLLLTTPSPLPPCSNTTQLKKALLLRTLEGAVSTATITHTTLETLEVIEELHHCDATASPVTPSIPAAYCAVALECTLKFLHDDEDDVYNPNYVKAIKRIWQGRIWHMDPSNRKGGSGDGCLLFSAELKHWRKEIEASLADPQLAKRLARFNTRRNAISKLKAYLAQAWAELGPSFIELAVSLLKNKPKCLNLGGDNAGACDLVSERERDMGGVGIEKEGSDKLGVNYSLPHPNQVAVMEIRERNETYVEDVGLSKTCRNVGTGVEEANPTTTGRKDGTSVEVLDSPKPCGKIHSLPPRPDVQLETLVKDHRESRFHLPTPKRKIVSPLKKHEQVNIIKRRKAKKWSAVEEETLRTAVHEVGEGNWKVILSIHPDVFSERTPTDLKDKWRNMTRYGGI